jgi:hypothetical protein
LLGVTDIAGSKHYWELFHPFLSLELKAQLLPGFTIAIIAIAGNKTLPAQSRWPSQQICAREASSLIRAKDEGMEAPLQKQADHSSVSG